MHVKGPPDKFLPRDPERVMRRIAVPNKPLILLAIAALATIGTTLTSSAARDPAKLKLQRDKLRREITALSSDRACTRDSDCATVELGSKSCGGPKEYLLYSKPNTKETLLKRRAAEYTAIDKRVNEIEQLMSDCMFVSPPGVKCVAKTCTDSNAPSSAEEISR